MHLPSPVAVVQTSGGTVSDGNVATSTASHVRRDVGSGLRGRLRAVAVEVEAAHVELVCHVGSWVPDCRKLTGWRNVVLSLCSQGAK